MYYNVQCTYVKMYISDFKKISKMFQKYSKLCLPGQYGKVRRAGQYKSKVVNQKPCTPLHCWLLPQRDRPVILISSCIIFRRILNS
jgi:hypothetical protein